jgi:ribosomal protein L32
MPVPKRKHSKSRKNKKRNAHYKSVVVTVIKTKDGKGLKRPHFDENKQV